MPDAGTFRQKRMQKTKELGPFWGGGRSARSANISGFMSCTEVFQGIRFFFFIIVKYRNYHRCSRDQYRLMLHLMFHLLERSVKLCKDVR